MYTISEASREVNVQYWALKIDYFDITISKSIQATCLYTISQPTLTITYEDLIDKTKPYSKLEVMKPPMVGPATMPIP